MSEAGDPYSPSERRHGGASPRQEDGARPLSEWLGSGRRFTEEDALLIALDLAAGLEQEHGQDKVKHPVPALESVLWSPEKRRARLSGSHADCGGFPEDVLRLGETVAALLGAADPKARSGLKLSPAFAYVLDRMLAEAPGGRQRTPAVLRGELGGALAGAPPVRAVLGSRRLHSRLVILAAVAALAWSVYRGLTAPNRVLALEGRVSGVAFSEDGRRLAAAHAGGARLWDTGTWSARELSLAKSREASWGRAERLAFSPDGRRLAVAYVEYVEPERLGSIHLFDLETGALLWSRRGFGEISALAFSPDAKLLAAAANRWRRYGDPRSTPGELLVLEAAGGAEHGRLGGGHDAFDWAGFTPEGRLQYRVRLWSGAANRYGPFVLGERDAALKEEERVLDRQPTTFDQPMTRSPDGTRIAVLDHGTEIVRILEPRGEGSSSRALAVLNGEIARLDYLYRAFTAGAFSPDGRRFAAAFSLGGRRGAKRRVRLWDATSWSLRMEKPLRGGRRLKNPVVRSLALSGRWLAAAYGNDYRTEIHLWNVAR